MLTINPVLNSDSYKQWHPFMYPKDMIKLYGNMTPRGTRFEFKQALWFGLQYELKEYLIKQWNENFFKVPKQKVIADFKRFHRHFSFAEIDTKHIEALHDLGYLPILIKALPEGALVNMRVPFYTITNTHPDFAWLVNFLETQVSNTVWDPTTIATISFMYRKLFSEFALKTTGTTEGVQWQGHDFSQRGRSSVESSCNQVAHLINFTGTDTIPAVLMAEEYYGANMETELIGSSVPATEHSVMTSYGKEDEIVAFRRVLEQFPKGIVSIVSDSFDFYKVLTEFMVEMKEEILAHDGKLVLRGDSGDPVKIIAGYKIAPIDLAIHPFRVDLGQYEVFKYSGKYYLNKDFALFEIQGDPIRYELASNAKEISEAEAKGQIEVLWDTFGGTINDLGYKILDPHVGAIYGDSITLDRAREICQRLMDKGFASTNWVAGIGSYTFNYNTRDSLGIAIKATYCEIGHPVTNLHYDEAIKSYVGTVLGAEIEIGDLTEEETQRLFLIEPREIFKDPITDSGLKKSAKGLLRVDEDGEGYYLTDQVSEEEEEGGCLIPVFKDGELLVDYTLAEIRQRVSDNINKVLDI